MRGNVCVLRASVLSMLLWAFDWTLELFGNMINFRSHLIKHGVVIIDDIHDY